MWHVTIFLKPKGLDCQSSSLKQWGEDTILAVGYSVFLCPFSTYVVSWACCLVLLGIGQSLLLKAESKHGMTEGYKPRDREKVEVPDLSNFMLGLAGFGGIRIPTAMSSLST